LQKKQEEDTETKSSIRSGKKLASVEDDDDSDWD